MHRAFSCIALTLLCLAVTAPAGAQVTPAELEGHWLLEPYIAALERSRSLLAASNVAPPLTFTIERDGSGHRMSVSTFHEASWHAIARVEPAVGRAGAFVLGPYEIPLPEATTFSRVEFDAGRDGAGKVTRMRMTLWGVGNAWFRRIDVPATELVNRLLVVGTWRDLDGERWAFDAKGTLLGPDGASSFSPSIDTSEACCDYLTIDGKRVGFALRDDSLWMYREFEDPDGCPISCDLAKPLRILVRDEAGDTTSRAALSRLELAALTADGSRWGGHATRVAVAFDNPERAADPEIFPEPPAVVTDREHGTRCAIDGGIWARDMVWLSADESLLALVAHSGSSAELEIYRTSDCRRTASAAVSGNGVRVSADRIEYDGVCEPHGDDTWDCVPAAIWRLLPDGTLEHLADESARRPRGIFGIEFTGRSDLAQPRTDRARVRRDPR
jgi:hypothetical protein